MARYGYLYCKKCKQEIFLGKWLHNADDRGIGFWHGTRCPEGVADGPLLGRNVLRFLAVHMDHDLLAASDDGGRADDLIDAGEHRDRYDEYDAWATSADAEPNAAPDAGRTALSGGS